MKGLAMLDFFYVSQDTNTTKFQFHSLLFLWLSYVPIVKLGILNLKKTKSMRWWIEMFVTIFKTNEYNELKVVDIKVGTKKKIGKWKW
jgi:hypothetical protein